MNKEMSGHDAWEIVAPIIASHIPLSAEKERDLLDTAYVTVFIALREMDQKKKSE